MSTACTAATFEGSGCLGTIADGVCSAEDDHHPTPGMLPYDGPGAESADTGQARPHHLVTSHWDAAGGEVLYRSCTCGEEWARDEDRCPEDDIETLDVADLLDRLDLIQARNPDEQRHLDDTLDALRRELAEPAGDTVQAPDVAVQDDDAVVAEAARRLIEASYTRRHDPVLSGGAGVHLRWLASWMHGPRRAEVAEVARALLGADIHAGGAS